MYVVIDRTPFASDDGEPVIILCDTYWDALHERNVRQGYVGSCVEIREVSDTTP